ncbi:MAG: DNA-binding protein WhiA [Clostridia bacterium]|nr:DNA-binding protein WhiA [Clostridia bacterium]
MSFANSLREELVSLPIKKPCCRAFATMGLLLSANLFGKREILLRTGNRSVADYAIALLSSQYGKNITVAESGKCGHRYFDLTVASPACAKKLQSLLSDEPLKSSCESCKGAFLRSVFLTSGTVNDPKKSLHLEFTLGEERAKILAAFLTDLGYPPKCRKKPGGVGIYYKDGASIEDLILQAGSHHVVYELMNTRIERDIRNNENRATNCVTSNIEKYVSASQKQVEAIAFLLSQGLFDRLDTPLQITAKLRYENPDATLSELASMHTPAVSRSGVNHRLQKIIEEAEKNGGGRV